jgi:hypothetical protein
MTLLSRVLSTFPLGRRPGLGDTPVVWCSNVFRACVRRFEYRMQLA